MSEKREKSVTDFLSTFDLDLESDDIRRTPERVSNLYADLFASIGEPVPTLSSFDSEDDDIVIIEDLKFHSICVHHLVPFFGSIDIAYRPSTKAAGFGGFNRLIDYVSKKPQLQERLTNELGDMIEAALAPKGLWIRCRARQLCVELRQGSDAIYSTITARGEFSDAAAQADLIKLFGTR